MSDNAVYWIDECAKLQTKIEELEADLKKYGWHLGGCPCVRTENDCEECTCGLDLALEKDDE